MNRSEYNNSLSRCVSCGSCKAFCTTYDNSPNEGMSARGRITLLYAYEKGRQPISKLLNERIYSCTLCGKCMKNCPLDIDIREIIYHARANLQESDKERRFLRYIMKLMMRSPNLIYKMYHFIYNNIFIEAIKEKINPFKIELPQKTFREKFNVITPQRKIGRIVIFSGCAINYIFPHIGESLIKILFKMGYEIIVPKGEVCCGTPFRTLGLENEAIKLAKKNVCLFNKLNAEAIISLCPSCTLTIKNDYPKLIGESINNIVDATYFLYNRMNIKLSEMKNVKILYHQPCHMKYGIGIENEPIELVKKAGYDIKLPREHKCCGFAGLFSLSFSELSNTILNECMNEYAKEDYDLISTTCPGCIIQLSKIINNKPVLHIVEILEDAI